MVAPHYQRTLDVLSSSVLNVEEYFLRVLGSILISSPGFNKSILQTYFKVHAHYTEWDKRMKKLLKSSCSYQSVQY